MEVPNHSRRFRTRQQIESDQLARLRELIATIALHNRFYRDKLRTSGLVSDFSDLEAFRRRMGFTLKNELQEDQERHPPYGTNLTFPLENYSRLCQTSGTTRAPLRWLDTPASWDWMVNCWSQVLERSGIVAADRLFFAFSFAPFLGFWTAFDAAARLGCLCIPGGGLGSSARLTLMRETRVTGLLCTPTYAIRLGEVAGHLEWGPEDLPVKAILVAGEPGGSVPGVRKRILELWPEARLIDHHGMTEIGPVSYQCPANPDRLHILESDYFAEVLEPDGATPVAPGQPGELVLTNLGRAGSPLIRYRTGDLVRTGLDQPCSCGSWEMALQDGILARLDDMIVIRGINVYPSAVEDVLRSFQQVEEYRVRIESDQAMLQMRLEVEPSPDCRDPGGLASLIGQALHQTFALRVPVIIVDAGSLPRFEMKARRWIRS